MQNQTLLKLKLKKFIEKLVEVDCKTYSVYCAELIRSFLIRSFIRYLFKNNCYAVIEYDPSYLGGGDVWRIKCYRDSNIGVGDDLGVGYPRYIDALNYILRLRRSI